MKRGAIVSRDGVHRTYLLREWDATKGTCLFIMLNPSVGDAKQDDATIRRCIGYAKRLGCGSLEIGNLFSYRATDPKELKQTLKRNLIGPDYWESMKDMLETADHIILAWGVTLKGIHGTYTGLCVS